MIPVARSRWERRCPRRREQHDSAAPCPRQLGGRHVRRSLISEQWWSYPPLAGKQREARCFRLARPVTETEEHPLGRSWRRIPWSNPSCRSGRLEESQLDGAFQRSPCRLQRSRFRHASHGAPIRDSVDEVLILFAVRTLSNGEGLPVRLRHKGRRPHVGHPNLDWAQALLT